MDVSSRSVDALMAAGLALLVIIFAAGALFAIEGWFIRHHQPTISEDVQRFNFSLGGQLLGGMFFLLGALAGWFVCHFASTPPGG
jgi:hypothetical protein